MILWAYLFRVTGLTENDFVNVLIRFTGEISCE